MKSIKLIIPTVLAVMWASGLHASCAMPEEIVVPNGDTATEEEIRNGRAAVQLFMSEMDAYLDCLSQEDQVKSKSLDYTPEDEKAYADQHNAAVNVMETVAARFNEQLRIFRSAKDNDGTTEPADATP